MKLFADVMGELAPLVFVFSIAAAWTWAGRCDDLGRPTRHR